MYELSRWRECYFKLSQSVCMCACVYIFRHKQVIYVYQWHALSLDTHMSPQTKPLCDRQRISSYFIMHIDSIFTSSSSSSIGSNISQSIIANITSAISSMTNSDKCQDIYYFDHCVSVEAFSDLPRLFQIWQSWIRSFYHIYRCIYCVTFANNRITDIPTTKTYLQIGFVNFSNTSRDNS